MSGPMTGALNSWPGVIEAYAGRGAIPAGARIVTLHEGGTPLVPAPMLSEQTGCRVPCGGRCRSSFAPGRAPRIRRRTSPRSAGR